MKYDYVPISERGALRWPENKRVALIRIYVSANPGLAN